MCSVWARNVVNCGCTELLRLSCHDTCWGERRSREQHVRVSIRYSCRLTTVVQACIHNTDNHNHTEPYYLYYCCYYCYYCCYYCYYCYYSY